MNNKHLIIKNLDVVYSDCGAGPLLLFLHGWGVDAFSFDTLMKYFGNNRCIALSFPGFGGSERPPVPWGVVEYAEFVRDFLTKLDFTPEIIIAHSFGGRVAVKGIGTGLLRAKKLVLIASAGVAKKSAQTRMVGSIAKFAKIFTAIPPLSFLRKRIKRLAGSRDYVSAGAMRETFVKVVNENLEKDAEKITIPTLLLWGANDMETPLIEAHTFRDKIRGSRLEVIPSAGHFVFQEQASAVAQKIKDFL